MDRGTPASPRSFSSSLPFHRRLAVRWFSVTIFLFASVTSLLRFGPPFAFASTSASVGEARHGGGGGDDAEFTTTTSQAHTQRERKGTACDERQQQQQQQHPTELN